MLKSYIVHGEVRQMTHGGMYEPPEYGSDVWEGEAENRRQARWLALRAWLAEGIEEPFNQKIGILEFEPCPEHGTDCERADYDLVEKRDWRRSAWERYRFKGHYEDEPYGE